MYNLHHTPTQPSPSSPLKRKQPAASDENLCIIFDALKSVNWTLGDFFYYLFRLEDQNGQPIHHSQQHGSYIHQLLNGTSGSGIGYILDTWMQNTDGVAGPGADGGELLYNTAEHYRQIRSARPALTSFVAQVVMNKLVREAEDVIHPSSSLHTSHGSQLCWADLSSMTIALVTDIIKKHQPLTWKYVTTICERPPRKWNGVTALRKYRPLVTGVAMNVISQMNFVCNSWANILGLMKGLFDFAFGVPHDVFTYNCHVANTVSYQAVCCCLEGLSFQEAKLVMEKGKTVNDARIGRINTMNVGIAATFIELEGISPNAFDFSVKMQSLEGSQRHQLMVTRLLRYIDQAHLDKVMSLHWLLILANYVPALTHIKKDILTGFRTTAAKLRLPVKASLIHPLATSRRNKTVTTELKDALFDFLEQIGQTEGDYQQRVTLFSGDGLTYKKIIQLKKYLQFHEDDLQSLRTLEPTLAVWHTLWTDVSRIFESHWGETLSTDPSCLAHSAAKIGRAAPSNLKKVDFYPYSELAYLVLEICVLDCWRLHFNQVDLFEYFENLAIAKKLPTMAELELAAQSLHHAYSSAHGIYHAIHDVKKTSDWSQTVPLGTEWHYAGDKNLSDAGATGNRMTETKEFKGDLVLARSIAFMRDALLSREAAYAAADGDVGWLYETLKVMMFTFAGSSHSKYVTYLLETITTLELEAMPELRDVILRSLLVNMSGNAGAFCALDFMQEYFNRMLQAIVQRKGLDYGADYIQSVIACNLHCLGQIKHNFREGFGLQARSSRHKAPHTCTEVRILLNVYHQHQLHSRCIGCRLRDNDNGDTIDGFRRGAEHLRKTKLAAWVKDTTSTQGMDIRADDVDDQAAIPTLGYMCVIDGELVIDPNIEDFQLEEDGIDFGQDELSFDSVE
ncbi:hypothetical protein SCLCIDRAFT_15631 [Scleroderma citrinum Foug A]|uniref:DUF6589 domain-containing protein n=1 Tax=Scleroderma citrinum Foug A TaxID=1036808 RepID=A0A0C3AE11_9AGAM|nr:hypothetical protein SCLCIDRAFT_15631 [Scleroderma citrinum Foug A]